MGWVSALDMGEAVIAGTRGWLMPSAEVPLDEKDRRIFDRELIRKGCEMLGMEVREVAEICIEGMKPYAEEIGLLGMDPEA